MTQNTTHAVMQQRHEARDSLDDFPTPPWATRAIVAELMNRGLVNANQCAREPCANRGYMVRPLKETFYAVDALDVHDYGAGYRVADYLAEPDLAEVDWTFMNPPFRLAQQFIEKGLETSVVGVAVLVRSAFVEGSGRYNALFAPKPPEYVFQHTERVPMVKGRYDPKASTATSYCWLVWLRTGQGDTRMRWIAPCRRQFERESDWSELLRNPQPEGVE